ncbi:hypothetical protein SUGI_0683110 [Cryptomeria japonica]|nr:hypothetical protein SUGI_0683110 [Cryptomeria japonica]
MGNIISMGKSKERMMQKFEKWAAKHEKGLNDFSDLTNEEFTSANADIRNNGGISSETDYQYKAAMVPAFNKNGDLATIDSVEHVLSVDVISTKMVASHKLVGSILVTTNNFIHFQNFMREKEL